MEWNDLLQYRFLRHANAYTNGNGYAYTDSYANCHGNRYAYTDSYANGDCDHTAAGFTDAASSADAAAAFCQLLF